MEMIYEERRAKEIAASKPGKLKEIAEVITNPKTLRAMIEKE